MKPSDPDIDSLLKRVECADHELGTLLTDLRDVIVALQRERSDRLRIDARASEIFVALREFAADLRLAPEGEAPDDFLNDGWVDSPHRVLYGLCDAVEKSCNALLLVYPANQISEGE